MVLGFYLPPTSAQAAPIQGQPWYRDAMVPEINAWLTIAPDDTVTIRVAQTEMGTGVFTSCPMMVAEELQCDWSKVRAEYASPHRNAVEKAPEWTMQVPGGGDPTHPRRRRRAGLDAATSPACTAGMRHQLERLGARKPLLSADGGRGSARTAAARRRHDVEGADLGTDGEGQRHHPRAERTADHLWGARRQGRADRAARSVEDQDQGAGPVHADRDRAEEPRRPAEGHRQGRLRHRCRSARHALCRRQGLSGVRRQGQELRLQRHQGSSRRPLGRRDSKARARKTPTRNERRNTVRRGRGRCRHLVAGQDRARPHADRMGRRAPTAIATPTKCSRPTSRP